MDITNEKVPLWQPGGCHWNVIQSNSPFTLGFIARMRGCKLRWRRCDCIEESRPSLCDVQVSCLLDARFVFRVYTFLTQICATARIRKIISGGESLRNIHHNGAS